MRLNQSIKLLLIIIITLTFQACKDDPVQYSSDGPSASKGGIIEQDSSSEELITFGVKKRSGEEVKTRLNSEKAITFGKNPSEIGASGITLNTIRKESFEVLSTPRLSVLNGTTTVSVYDEGMYIYWRNENPRLPEIIWLNEDYKGAIDIGGTIGKLYIRKDLGEMFTEDDPNAEGFLIELYNQLYKKDSNYNCIKKKTCSRIDFPGGKYSLYMARKFLININIERKIVADIRLVYKADQGKLDADIDIINGKFLISNELSKNVKIDDLWKISKDKIGEKGFFSTYMDSFIRAYEGINIEITKSSFLKDYIIPDELESIKSISVNSGFTNNIKFGNSYVKMTYIDDEFDVKLVDEVEKPTDNIKYLKINDGIKASEKALQQLIRQITYKIREIQENSGKIVLHRYSGFHNIENDKYLTSTIYVMDKEFSTMKTYEFGIHLLTGNIAYFAVSNAKSDLKRYMARSLSNRISIPIADSKEDLQYEIDFNGKRLKYNKKLTTLANFEIGQIVRIKNIDQFREEADLVVTQINQQNINARVTFKKEMTTSGIYSPNGYVIKDEVYIVSTEQLGVNLKLKKHDENIFMIVGVSVSYLPKGITGLCGLKTTFAIGMSDLSVLDKLNKAIVKKEEADTRYKCVNFKVKKGDGSQNVSDIFFVDHRVRFVFSENELKVISIYERPSEVE